MSQRTATKSQAASRAKARANEAAATARDRAKVDTNLGTRAQRMNEFGTKYSGKLAGAMRRANAPKSTSVSSLDKKKMRSPEAFSPQDVAAAIGRKAVADTNAGKFKSRNEAYKASQAAVDAQKARFGGYSPSARSDTSAIAGYGGINPRNMGLGVQAAFNQAQNRNETTGMGLLDSARFQVTRPEFKQDIDNLVNVAKAIPTPTNILRKVAGAVLSPGAEEEETQTAGLRNFGLGNLFSSLRSSDPTLSLPERGGNRPDAMPAPPMVGFPGEQRPTLPIETLPVQPQPTVDPRILNQYLSMAGFSPEEVSGFTDDIRYLSANPGFFG